MLLSWEGMGPGTWCQLSLSTHKGAHYPLPLQDVLWEFTQDPNWQVLSLGLEGALK